MAEERLAPRGERRADIRAALICLVLASIHRGKGTKPKLEDFLLDFDNEKKHESQTPAQMKRVLQQMAHSFEKAAKKKAAQPKREPRKPKEKSKEPKCLPAD